MLNYSNPARLWRVYGRSVFSYGSPRKLWNAIQTEVAYRRRTSDVKSRPYLLFIEPNYTCNLHCPLCQRQAYAGARTDRSKLSLENFDRLLDQLGDYLYQCHIFGLGEPLLNWNLTRQIVEKAHRRRIFTLLSTNCTVITETLATEVMKSGLDYLVCAIDGISQESYSKYRVGGSIEKALEGLRMFRKAQLKTRSSTVIEWQFLVHRYNYHEVEAARAMAQDLGVFIRFAQIGGVEWNEELQEEWLAPDKDGFQRTRISPGAVLNPYHCFWLWRGIVVNSDGQMARCPGYQNVATLGNVSEAPVMDLYNGPASQRSRQLFQKEPVPEGPFPTPCSTCNYYQREHGCGDTEGKEAPFQRTATASARK
jgi:MoaA/NifB/PqqE/SkfB family radical SAM enzyme